MIRISPLVLPDPRLAALVAAASREGFEFLDRLDREWNEGSNRFDGDGETLLGVCDGDALIAIGGLNLDPYDPARGGRLRRVYVRADRRGGGIGRQLVETLLDRARPCFVQVRLRAGTEDAGRFYDRLGFSRTDEPDATHVIRFGRPLTQ